MTKESLNRTEISPIHEEVGRERMTQSVGGDVLCYSGGFGIFFDYALDRAWS